MSSLPGLGNFELSGPLASSSQSAVAAQAISVFDLPARGSERHRPVAMPARRYDDPKPTFALDRPESRSLPALGIVDDLEPGYGDHRAGHMRF